MRRLQSRIFFHFLGVLCAVALVTVAVFLSGWRNAFPRSLTERLVTLAAVEVGERWGEPTARDKVVRRMAAQLDVSVTVRDPSGKVVVERGPELPPLSEAEQREASAGPAFAHHGRDWFVVAPILDAQTGELHGYLQSTPVRRFRGPSPIRPILGGVLALVIVAVLTVPLARRISRPVERLTEATRRFGDGDLSARVPVMNDGDPGCEPGNSPRARWRRHRREHHRRHRRVDEIEELSRAWNEMADRVEHLVRGQKELLANVSHELRSPLARIRMALELVPRAPADETRIRDIELDLGELDRLIEDVLTASRLEATGLPAHIDRVEVRALLDGLAERVAFDPRLAAFPVTVDCAPDLALEADPALLRRALWNLVENATKYGAPPITLAARPSVDGSRVDLSVSDEGPGIPAADRQRVLDAFTRLDKARTPGAPTSGFGLGLTIARRVAEVHGGTIRVEAARHSAGVDLGCRIVISVPAKRPAA